MLPITHQSASELNRCHDDDDNANDKDNNDEEENVVTRELLPTNGFSERRPVALPPLNTNLKIITSQHDVNTPLSPAIEDPQLRTPTKAAVSFDVSKSETFIDIGFTNLTFTVKAGLLRRENKTILNGINGQFKSGELTAIMGPSGAGKSTLMDILSGYTTTNVSGELTINGTGRDLKRFRRQAAYIMQDHNLHEYITVLEAMHFSANLKIGSEMSQSDKKLRIKQILEAIALYECRRTRCGQLSGGQRKRLAIALEIFDNPPVMFFDEPTSGLDSSTSTQVVMLLKKLAEEGRTIVTTIHQPSKIVFDMFDHLYAIADGKCIYTGATQSLVPFLAKLDLICPDTYSPSDYLLEVSTHDYGYQNDKLIAESDNGKQTEYHTNNRCTVQNNAMERAEQMMAEGLMTPIVAPNLNTNYTSSLSPLQECQSLTNVTTSEPKFILSPLSQIPEKCTKPKKIQLQIGASNYCQRSETYATSFCRQLTLLMMRTTLVIWRDKSLTAMRLFIHALIATLIGTMYMGIGNDAENVFNNFRYIFFSIMFLMFTAFSSVTMAFPSELPIVTREHFNRWYSLKAYFTALSLADAPIQFVCILIYITITYLMTAQPLEPFRVGLFFAILLMVSLVAQSLGLVVGALFNVKNGAIFGPFFICPFLIFSGFFVQLSAAHPLMHWLFHISFLKYALEGASLAIFGYDRPKFNCHEVYCHFILPKKFMQTVDMHNGDYLTAMIALLSIFCLFRTTAFYVMSFRLRWNR